MTRSELINALIERYRYRRYLEIGVNTPAQPGWNFDSIQVAKKDGVDPDPRTKANFVMTSDEFFARHIREKYDLVFVDGLHLYEQAYRDIVNSLEWLSENGTIVVHDCNPTSEITQRRERASDAWHGDVWRAILQLRLERPDVSIYTVDTDEGCAVIRRGSQKLFQPPAGADLASYEFFDRHRLEILQLISVAEFKNQLNASTTVILQGGLGNQLFQYALGRALSLKNGSRLLLDLSRLGKNDPNRRQYALAPYNIKADLVPPSLFPRLIPLWTRWRPKKNNRRIVSEKDFRFDPSVLALTGSVSLVGYWQSEKYFQDIAPILQADLALKPEHLKAVDPLLLENVAGTISVGLHVRRTDYISNPATQAYHGHCDSSYYQRAMELMRQKRGQVHFFVFSDDLAWCRENLKSDLPLTFVDGQTAAADLYLMSQCRHQIIANSSFSWWAAWLNNNPDKLVIAPQRWFAGAGHETDDLLPDGWIKI